MARGVDEFVVCAPVPIGQRASLDAWAGETCGGNRAELVRRMIAFSSVHMPRGWQPPPEEPPS